jgi:phospholipid transport system substrate-binding protein
MVRILGTVALSVLTLGATEAVEAGTPTEEVRRYTDQVQKILDDRTIPSADRRAAVRKVAEQIFDLNETAKRALGPHWAKRSAAEQQEFAQLFADLLEQTYIAKIDLYGGERLQYTTESVDGDYAIVRARVLARQAEVPVEARMHRRDGRWLIYDVAIESVSLVRNYRSQFDRIIRTSSYEELVRRLKILSKGASTAPTEPPPG